ncbi:hypothetical protein Tco_0432368 [Tanacetum coccineum]
MHILSSDISCLSNKQIYVDDIIFGSTNKELSEILKKFNYTDVKSASTPVYLEKPLVKDGDANDVDVHLYRSMIGSLMYLTTSRPDIMFAVCACARFQVTPKTSHLLAVKIIFRYLKGKPILGLWYSKDSPFELVAYTDSDYARATQDRKFTTGGCQFLGNRLISWQCKKQTMVATSTTEVEYMAVASCCGQVLWIQNQLLDYGYNFMNTVINIDNNSTICIIKNPVQHSKTKHIEIRHHFIRDCNAKKLVQMVKIHTDYNVANLLTKGFDAGRHVKRGRDTKVPQSSCPLVKVGDEAVHKELGDRMERAATTVSSLEAEQDSGSGPRCQDTILGDVDAQTRHQLVLPVFVYAARFNLLLSVVKCVFENPVESDGFAEIIDFLKASSVHYALTVNPIIYTSCIQQFWATTNVKMVNGVRQLQALIDKKKMIIMESSIRSDLHLEDAEGTDCLPTTTIFEELAKMGAKSTTRNEFSSTMASLIICLATNQKFNLSKYIFDAMLGDMSHHKKIHVNPSHTKKFFANIKRVGKDFSRKITPLFDTMMVQACEEVGEDLDHPTDSTQIPIVDQPYTSSQPKKKQKSKRNQRKEAEVAHDETEHAESVPTPSNDPLPSKDASKQGRRIKDIDADAEVPLVNETQERQDEDLMFDTGVMDDDEVFVDVTTVEKEEQSTKTSEAITTSGVEDSVVPTIPTTVSKPTVSVTQPTQSKKKGKRGSCKSLKRPLTKKRYKVAILMEDLARKKKGFESNMQEEANIALIESWEIHKL